MHHPSPAPTANHQCDTPNNGTPSANHHLDPAGQPAPAQALLAGAVRVGLPAQSAPLSVRHLQRQLTVPTTALKLAANRQIPKVPAGSTTLDMGTR